MYLSVFWSPIHWVETLGRWLKNTKAASLKWTMQRPKKKNIVVRRSCFYSQEWHPKPWYKHVCYEDLEAWNLMMFSFSNWRLKAFAFGKANVFLVLSSHVIHMNFECCSHSWWWTVEDPFGKSLPLRQRAMVLGVLRCFFLFLFGCALVKACVLYVSYMFQMHVFFGIFLRLPEFNKVALSCNISTGNSFVLSFLQI